MTKRHEAAPSGKNSEGVTDFYSRLLATSSMNSPIEEPMGDIPQDAKVLGVLPEHLRQLVALNTQLGIEELEAKMAYEQARQRSKLARDVLHTSLQELFPATVISEPTEDGHRITASRCLGFGRGWKVYEKKIDHGEDSGLDLGGAFGEALLHGLMGRGRTRANGDGRNKHGGH